MIAKFAAHKVYESIYYLPVVLSLAVIGIIWQFMLGPGGFTSKASWAAELKTRSRSLVMTASTLG
jgi:ABC-type sugar transport system permease subunit